MLIPFLQLTTAARDCAHAGQRIDIGTPGANAVA
jgi:hypothetical protein